MTKQRERFEVAVREASLEFALGVPNNAVWTGLLHGGPVHLWFVSEGLATSACTLAPDEATFRRMGLRDIRSDAIGRPKDPLRCFRCVAAASSS